MIKVLWPKKELDDIFGDKLEKNLEQFGREFCQELFNEVVAATPVKTGMLRGSWFDAVNQEPEGEGSPGRAPQGNASGWKIGDVYYAVNTAKYAGFVEYGTRKMAPRAYVRGTVARVSEIARRVAQRIKAS
jgi:hypothetical protein